MWRITPSLKPCGRQSREEFAKRCVWQPLMPVQLKDSSEAAGGGES